jgi:hypothetical protein
LEQQQNISVLDSSPTTVYSKNLLYKTRRNKNCSLKFEPGAMLSL